jgi:hypothetical protein
MVDDYGRVAEDKRSLSFVDAAFVFFWGIRRIAGYGRNCSN